MPAAGSRDNNIWKRNKVGKGTKSCRILTEGAAICNMAIPNLVINQSVNTETDSSMLKKMEDFSKDNVVRGVSCHEKLIADSPMVKCLQETVNPDGENFCAAGIAYVFYGRPSQGKSSAIRYFCRKDCKKTGRRSIHIGASSAGGEATTYFQPVAADLEVDFMSNWARCLIAAMKKTLTEKLSPILVLDEFNEGSARDVEDINRFMRECQNFGFYLIIVTSKIEIANLVMNCNAWGKMRPLKYIHNGPTTNIPGQLGYEANKVASWKEVEWSDLQLIKVVICHEGEKFDDDYSFIVPKMTPTDALVSAREAKEKITNRGIVHSDSSSSLSAGT